MLHRNNYYFSHLEIAAAHRVRLVVFRLDVDEEFYVKCVLVGVAQVRQRLWTLKNKCSKAKTNQTRTCLGLSIANGLSASIVTIHGEMVVPKLLPRNGPSGTYSHF